MGKKLTIEEMHFLADKREGRCLSDKYVNNQTKLKWQCKEGHSWLARPNDIKQGQWCPFCSHNVRLSIENMHELAKSYGGSCLSTKYVNNRTKLNWQCEKGHIWNAVPGSVIRGHWCSVCSKAAAGKKRKQTIEQMQEYAKAKDGECLSSEYKSAKENLMWKCAKEHVWLATPDRTTNRGQWCKICAKEKRSLERKERTNIKCQQCGKEFLAKPSLIAVGRCKYCSKACHYEANRHYKKELDHKEIVRLYIEEKKPATWIAKDYGCDCNKIYDVLREEGISRRNMSDAKKGIIAKNPRYRTDLDAQALVKDYMQGMGGPEIAKKYHCSAYTILRHLKKAGCIVRTTTEAQKLFLKGDRFPEWSNSLRKNIIKQYQTGVFPRQVDTDIEQLIRDELVVRGYVKGTDFIQQYNLNDKFSCDFCFPAQKLIIECYGDWHHANPKIYARRELHPIQKKTVGRDKGREAYIKTIDNGAWTLIIFWGLDIKKDVKSCVDRIEKVIGKKRSLYRS